MSVLEQRQNEINRTIAEVVKAGQSMAAPVTEDEVRRVFYAMGFADFQVIRGE